MGVQVRERKLAGGLVTFDCDCYHSGQRISIKTGDKVDPLKKREYAAAKRAAEVKAKELEALLLKDPLSVFEKKQRNHRDFIGFCERLAKSRSKTSCWWSMIKYLRDYHGQNELPMAYVSEVFGQRFRNYLAALESCKNTSKQHYLASFKAAVRIAAKEGYIEDFAGKLENFKHEDVQRNFLTIEHVEALEETDCGSDVVKYAFLFSCFTGLRCSDVEALQFDDVKRVDERKYITFKQKKTQKFEWIPLNSQASMYLSKGAELHECLSEDELRIFPLPGRTTLGKHLERWGKKAGIPFHLHFHVSRHTYAALSLQGGVPIYNLSKMMGHSRVSMTEIYSHLIPEAKIAAVDALPVPRERKALV
jgi:integrase